ncbi:putative mRNA (2'-O-methyladenosine-N(6)-)-methyltransferase [Helianthus anomalus]
MKLLLIPLLPLCITSVIFVSKFLSPEFFGTKFDVILVDPPWEEYVHRAPSVADHMEYWTFEEIMNLKIEVAIADTPSFVFLWVGDQWRSLKISTGGSEVTEPKSSI